MAVAIWARGEGKGVVISDRPPVAGWERGGYGWWTDRLSWVVVGSRCSKEDDLGPWSMGGDHGDGLREEEEGVFCGWEILGEKVWCKVL